MRILYFVTQAEQGGAQKYVADLALGLKNSHKIFVATGIQKEEKDKWLFETLEKGGIKKENLFEIKNHVREIKILTQLKGLFDFIKLVKKINPDVIHANSSMAGFVAAITGFVTRKKVVFTVHGFFFLEPMSSVKKILFIFLEFVSSLLRNFTILITEKDISAGKKFFILRSPKNYGLIYNGVSEKIKTEMLDKNSAREYLLSKVVQNYPGQMATPSKEGEVEQFKIVGTISNLYKTKGLEYLIDAAAKIIKENSEKKLPIFIVLGFGEESYKKELENRIKKNNLENNFFLLGKTPSGSKYLKAFDLFTLTSVKEGLPYTLLEAKMAGVPILATNVGGIPEMAKNFPINLVESKNVEQITNKILELVSPSLEGGWSMSPTGPGSFNDSLPEIYSLENMISKTEKVYKNLQ